MINICKILLNGSNNEYQTIMYNPDDKRLYTTAMDEPISTTTYQTMDEAIEACRILWGIDPNNVWDLSLIHI